MRYDRNPWFSKDKQKYGFYPTSIWGWFLSIFYVVVLLYLFFLAYKKESIKLLILVLLWIYFMNRLFRFKRDRLVGWRRHSKKIQKRRDHKCY